MKLQAEVSRLRQLTRAILGWVLLEVGGLLAILKPAFSLVVLAGLVLLWSSKTGRTAVRWVVVSLSLIVLFAALRFRGVNWPGHWIIYPK